MALKGISVFVILTCYFSFDIKCQDIDSQLFNNLLGKDQSSLENNFETDSSLIGTKLLKDKRSDGSDSSSGISSSQSNTIHTDPWPGRWLPEKVEEKPKVSGSVSRGHLDQMYSMIDSNCDDGQTNLTLDWSGSPENYTCFHQTIVPNLRRPAFIVHDYIPTEYMAVHLCMDTPIEYNSYLPTFGTHRPAWPRYGEYKFLPRQRWIHSLEHGGIVMLYHPCAHPLLVRKLRDLVTSCLYRHIITPYTLLSPKRPLALLAWGWAMTMSNVDETNVQEFIRSHALQGPEKLAEDGKYDYLLTHPAELVTSEDDSTVCPNRIITM